MERSRILISNAIGITSFGALWLKLFLFEEGMVRLLGETFAHVNYHVNVVNVEANVGLFASQTLVEITFSTNVGISLSFHVSSHVNVTNVEANVGLLLLR